MTARNVVVMNVAVPGESAEDRPVNVAVVIVPADPMAATDVVPVHRKAVRNAVIGPVANGLGADAALVTSATSNANAGNRLRLYRTLALRCFRTTKASNRSRARFG